MPKTDHLSRSVFGRVPTAIYQNIRLIERKLGDKLNILIVDCVDGHILNSLARMGHYVTGFEEDEIFVYGGRKEMPIANPKTNEIKIVKKTMYGLVDRINSEFLNDNVNIINKNFYSSVCKEKYDLVISYRSLNRSNNSNLSMDKKIKKLQSCIKENGYILINYLFANDENDYIKYPSNRYARGLEVENLFPINKWKIISIQKRENCLERGHVGDVYDHYHTVGHFLAKKSAIVLKQEIKENKKFKINSM